MHQIKGPHVACLLLWDKERAVTGQDEAEDSSVFQLKQQHSVCPSVHKQLNPHINFEE